MRLRLRGEGLDRLGGQAAGDRDRVVRARDGEAAQHRDEVRRLVRDGEAHRGERAAQRVFEQAERLFIRRQAERAELQRVAGIRGPDRDRRNTLERGVDRLALLRVADVHAAGEAAGARDVDERERRRLRIDAREVASEAAGRDEGRAAGGAIRDRFRHRPFAADDREVRVEERHGAVRVVCILVRIRFRQDVVAVLLHRAALHEGGGEALDVEAPFGRDEDVGFMAKRGARRRRDDEHVDVLRRIEAGVRQELRGVAVGRDLVGLLEQHRGEWARTRIGEADHADRDGVVRDQRHRVVLRERAGSGQCDGNCCGGKQSAVHG